MWLNRILRRPFATNGRASSFVRNCFGCCVVVGVVAAAEVAVAATINVSTDLSSPLSATGIASFTASDMEGMIVTAGSTEVRDQRSGVHVARIRKSAGVLDWFDLEVGNTSNSLWLLFNLTP